MKTTGKKIFVLGLIFVFAGMGILAFHSIRTKDARLTNAVIVEKIESIVTDKRPGSKDTDLKTEMPSLEIGGDDYIAVLEIPAYGLKLPVAGKWDKGDVASTPCRFTGRAYDGTLVIGGYDSAGQFDFFDRIDNDTVLTITDMTGCVFTYVVEYVERSDNADSEVLISEGCDLALFVRDSQLLKYIIVRCKMK